MDATGVRRIAGCKIVLATERRATIVAACRHRSPTPRRRHRRVQAATATLTMTLARMRREERSRRISYAN